MRLCLSLCAALALTVASVEAQSLPEWAEPGPPPASAPTMAAVEPPPPPPAPAQVPLDGGLGLLALAGGAYAARRLRQRS